jgi:hypothetical protein
VGRTGRILSGAACFALGTTLVTLAWADFRAHWAAAAGDSAALLLRSGELPTEEGFRRLLSSREAGSGWSPKAAFDRDRGFAYIALYQQSEDETESARALGNAESSFFSAVTRSPSNPEGLAMLGYVRNELDRPEAAAQVLRLGCRLVPYAPEQSLIRVWTEVSAWDVLTPLDRVCAVRDFKAAMNRDPDRFVEMIAGAGLGDEAHRAIEDDEALLTRFDAGLQALLEQQ